MGLRLPELLVIGAVAAVLLLGVLPLLCAIHAALKPDDAWRAAEQSKVVWVLVLVGCMFVPFGFIAAGVYWLRVRPKLVRAPRDPGRSL